MKKSPLICLLVLLSYMTLAQGAIFSHHPLPDAPQIISPYDMAQYDEQIDAFYTQKALPPKQQLVHRLDFMSQYFLGKPYLLGALGEGANTLFDEDPLYRTDAFDCLTYVNTVLALTLADNRQEFVDYVKRINYQDGDVSYSKRNHFTLVDWNENNQRNGYFKDITDMIVDSTGHKVAVEGKTWTNKQAWYRLKKLTDIKLLQPISEPEQQGRLATLRGYGDHINEIQVNVKYIPLTALFTPQGPRQTLFSQIPDGAIIEIVRPYVLRGVTVENLGVSHLGFAINTPKGLMFRQASTLSHKVVDIPLMTYLEFYYRDSNVKGIIIKKVI